MASQAVEKELLGLERRYWQAQKDKDGAAAADLTDDQCLLTGAQGVMQVDPQMLVRLIKDVPWTLHDYSINDDVHVRMLGSDSAIVAYKVHEELTVEGESVTVDAADASVWVRRDGHWFCALHTESLVGDPFGRDRKNAPPSQPA
jgi:hypothetical protein